MIDIATETWALIKKACEQGIENGRNQLEVYGCNETAANFARGQISAFKAVLSLTDPKKVEPSGDYSKRTDRSGI